MNKDHVIHIRLSEGQYNDLVAMMIEKDVDDNVSAFVRQLIKKEINDYFSEKKND